MQATLLHVGFAATADACSPSATRTFELRVFSMQVLNGCKLKMNEYDDVIDEEIDNQIGALKNKLIAD